MGDRGGPDPVAGFALYTSRVLEYIPGNCRFRYDEQLAHVLHSKYVLHTLLARSSQWDMEED